MGSEIGLIFLDLAGALIGIVYLVVWSLTLCWVQDLAGWLFGQIYISWVGDFVWLGWVGMEFGFVGLGL